MTVWIYSRQSGKFCFSLIIEVFRSLPTKMDIRFNFSGQNTLPWITKKKKLHIDVLPFLIIVFAWHSEFSTLNFRVFFQFSDLFYFNLISSHKLNKKQFLTLNFIHRTCIYYKFISGVSLYNIIIHLNYI